MVKEWFDHGILRLIHHREVDTTVSFVAVARQSEVDWDALGFCDWYHYAHSTGKLSHVGGLASMVCKLADGIEKMITDTESVRHIYCQEFATRDMSFDFAKAVWLQYPDKKEDYFRIPSLEARDALLKRRPSSAASVVDKGQMSSAAAVGADDHDGDEDD